MTDVLLRQTDDGGEIFAEGGRFAMSDGLETAVYLSLFGGNEQDAGGSDTTQQYWGNVIEPEPTRQYRSETQYLVRALPAVPANLRRIEQAAERDLQWMLDTGVAQSLAVSARIPELNRIAVDVTVVTRGQQIYLSFG